VNAATNADEEGSYEFVLETLTDSAEEQDFSHELLRMKEAFEELSGEEQDFCRQYFEKTSALKNAERQRMQRLRKRLRERLLELRAADASNTTEEVYAG